MQEAFQWISQYGLVGVSILILSCGIGAPVSQDLIVIIVGFLIGQKVFGYLDALIVCLASIITADIMLYHIGKLHKYIPFVHKILTPKRRRWIEGFFKKFGSLSIFLVAFIPGVRSPTFITAGVVGMPLWKYIIWDFIGMGIVTSLELFLVSRVKLPLATLEKNYHNIAIYILAAFIVVVLLLISRHYLRKKK